MVVIGLVFGALSGYGLGFLGSFGRILCAILLFIHALYLLLAILMCFLDRTPGESGRIGPGSLTEYLAMALGFDAALILSGRLAGVAALEWRWVGGAAAVTLICAVLLELRYAEGWRSRFARG